MCHLVTVLFIAANTLIDGTAGPAPHAPNLIAVDVPSYRVSHFIERKDPLQHMENHLKPQGKDAPPSIFVLQGMGGCGKSQLALEFCRRARNSGTYSTIFWIDATSPESTIQSCNSIAKAMSKTPFDTTDNEANLQFIRRELGSSPQPWLLVFDNFDDPASFIDKTIKDYFPQLGQGSILVTSRHADTKRLGRHLEVEKMSQEEALELLFARNNTEKIQTNLDHGEAIVKRLGFHALAIDQAGAYISSRNLDLELYLEHYNSRTKKVLQEVPDIWDYIKAPKESPEAKRKLSVLTTWELSFDQISGDQSERERKERLLTLLSFFDNNHIPESLFENYAEYPDNWITESGEWKSYDFQDVLRELWTLSLLQSFEVHSSGAVCSLHPLIQDWIKFRISREAQRDFAIQAVLVLNDFLRPHFPNRFSDLSFDTRQLIYTHVEAVLANSQRLFSEDEFLADLDLLLGAQTFSAFLLEYGKYEAAENLIRTAVEGRTNLLGERGRETLLAKQILADVLLKRRKLKECELISRRVSELYTQTLGDEDERTLTSMSHLFNSLHGQGKHEEALEIPERLFAIRQAVLGDEHPRTLVSMHNFAKALEAQGRLEDAESLYRKDLSLSVKINGAEHVETLTSMHNLANLLQKKGQFNEAEILYRETMILGEKVLGKEHPNTLSSMSNLASTLDSQCSYEEAELLYRETISLRTRVLGKERPETLMSIHNLAFTLGKQEKYHEAEVLYQEVIYLKKKVLGEEHPDTLASMYELAFTLGNQEKYNEAEVLYREVISLRTRVLGKEHPKTLASMHELGFALNNQEKYNEAEVLYREVISLRTRVLGKEHPDTITSMHNLAYNLYKQTKYSESELLFREVVDLEEKRQGKDHRDTLVSVDWLLSVFEVQEKDDEAEALRRRFPALESYMESLIRPKVHSESSGG